MSYLRFCDEYFHTQYVSLCGGWFSLAINQVISVKRLKSLLKLNAIHPSHYWKASYAWGADIFLLYSLSAGIWSKCKVRFSHTALGCGVLQKERGWKTQVEWRYCRTLRGKKCERAMERKTDEGARGRLGYLQITSQCDRFLWRLNWAPGLRGNQSKSWVTGK